MVSARFVEQMSIRSCCALSLLVALFPLLSTADSASGVKLNAASPATSVHVEGASPEDAIWAKNVSALIDFEISKHVQQVAELSVTPQHLVVPNGFVHV